MHSSEEKTQTMIHSKNAMKSSKEMYHVCLHLHLHCQLTCIHVASAFIQLMIETLDNPSI